MCGRFAAGNMTQAQMQDIVEGFLDAPVLTDADAPAAKGGYHIRPTQRIALVEQVGDGVVLTSANWQVAPEGGRPLINARIENAGFWQDAWAHGRCMIPALGYFEWTEMEGRKQPVFITVKRNAPVIFFAGFRGPGGQGCVILTRPPSPQIAHIHSRMPVILSPEDIADWLSGAMPPDAGQAQLGTGWDGRFTHHRIAPLTQEAEDEAVIESYEPPQASFDF